MASWGLIQLAAYLRLGHLGGRDSEIYTAFNQNIDDKR